MKVWIPAAIFMTVSHPGDHFARFEFAAHFAFTRGSLGQMPMQRPQLFAAQNMTRDESMPVVAFRAVVTLEENFAFIKCPDLGAERRTDVDPHVDRARRIP